MRHHGHGVEIRRRVWANVGTRGSDHTLSLTKAPALSTFPQTIAPSARSTDLLPDDPSSFLAQQLFQVRIDLLSQHTRIDRLPQLLQALSLLV